jgi:hypothetical protein
MHPALPRLAFGIRLAISVVVTVALVGAVQYALPRAR